MNIYSNLAQCFRCGVNQIMYYIIIILYIDGESFYMTPGFYYLPDTFKECICELIYKYYDNIFLTANIFFIGSIKS